jgi:pantetheine-phosphate adenylyltransferase
MVRRSFVGVKRVAVVRYDGLIVECMKEFGATALIRGLRALSDVEYEFQMAFTNRNMNELAETVFLMPSAKYIYLSSSMVKQIARLGGNVTSFVPPHVAKMLKKKFATNKRNTT